MIKKRKLIFGIIFAVFLVSFAFAAPDLEIEKVNKGDAIISELNNPAVYEFHINNKGSADVFEIYSLVGVSMSPKGTFVIPQGESTLEVLAFPGEEFRSNLGSFNFEYQLRGQNSGIYKDQLNIRIIPLKDTISFKVQNIAPGDQTAVVSVRNLQNANLNTFKLDFKSEFFESEQEISLNPFEEKNITVVINEDIKNLVAGPYVVTADIDFEGAKERFDATVNYLEKEGTSISQVTTGIISRKTNVTKINEGNTQVQTSVSLKKDILSRLFTSYSMEPTKVERNGLVVIYTWSKTMQPGEVFTVIAKTNYTFPFIVLILVLVIIFLIKYYSLSPLIVKKRVSFVRTSGGEFALKVRLNIVAKKNISKVRLSDTLPANTKLYEKYGKHPDKIDEKFRKLYWEIGSMNAGEERVFSYVVYSKVRVVGRFELPHASASFVQGDGKADMVLSNKAYFVSETSSG